MKANCSSIVYELPTQAESGKRPKKQYRIRFNCAKDAVRLLSKTVNGVINRTIPLDEARVLISAAVALANTYQATEVEDRLKALEGQKGRK